MKNRAAYFGVFTALALIFSYIETLIPIQFGVPGIKLGLANLIIVIVLYRTGWREALLLSVVRVVLAGFIFGNLFSIVYSLAGGIFSLAVMALLKKTERFSVIGISIAGGVCHNIGQLIVAMVVVETYQVGYYLPVLLIAGVITGAVIGAHRPPHREIRFFFHGDRAVKNPGFVSAYRYVAFFILQQNKKTTNVAALWSGFDQWLSLALPFALLRAKTFLPSAVAILFRKPCTFLRWIFFG